jgi:hypothetical protein
MSTFSELKELYGGLEGTWSQSRAHVFSHVIAGFIIFVWCGVTFPAVALPQIDPAGISQSPWYGIAKDTGLIYVVLVVPLLILSAYAAFLRILGGFFNFLLSLFSHSNPPFSMFQGLAPWDLEPLALTLNNDSFSLNSLTERFGTLVLKYQSTNSERWLNFQKTLPAVTQNSIQYFGDFCVLLLFWITAFWLWPNSSWAVANTKHFWTVVWVFLLLVGLSWTRVSRARRILPPLLLQACSAAIRADPEFSSLFVGNDERREHIRTRLEALLGEQQERQRKRITFWYLVSRVLQLSRPKGNPSLSRGTFKATMGFYQRGELLADYDFAEPPSLLDLGAYLYYRAFRRISMLMKTIKSLLFYVFFGIP